MGISASRPFPIRASYCPHDMSEVLRVILIHFVTLGHACVCGGASFSTSRNRSHVADKHVILITVYPLTIQLSYPHWYKVCIRDVWSGGCWITAHGIPIYGKRQMLFLNLIQAHQVIGLWMTYSYAYYHLYTYRYMTVVHKITVQIFIQNPPPLIKTVKV